MHKLRYTLYLCFVLILSMNQTAPISAQDSYNLPKAREPITAANADKVVELATIRSAKAAGITSVTLSADGTVLAFTVRNDQSIHLVDVSTGKETGKLQGHTSEITHLAL